MILPYNPQIISATPQVFTTSATSVTITRPTCNIGDRLLVMLNRSSASSDAIATPSGLTALDTSSLTGTASSFCRAYYQDVTHLNIGDASFAFTGGTNTESTSLIWLVRGCDLSVAPVANGTAQGSNLQTVDPAALTGPNSGVSQRNLWFVYLGTAAQDALSGATPIVTSGFPAGYGNTGTSTTADAGANANGCGQGWGSKVAVAGSDDPGAWTYCPNQVCRSFAINVAMRGVIEMPAAA